MMKLTISFLSALLLISSAHGKYLRSEFSSSSKCNSSEQTLLKSSTFQLKVVDLVYSQADLSVDSLVKLKLNGKHLDIPCATCVINGYVCLLDKCAMDCISDGCSEECDDCMFERCYPAIDACTGVPRAVDPCEFEVDPLPKKISNSVNDIDEDIVPTTSTDKKDFSIDTSKISDSILTDAQKDQFKQLLNNVNYSFDSSKISDTKPSKEQMNQLLGNIDFLSLFSSESNDNEQKGNNNFRDFALVSVDDDVDDGNTVDNDDVVDDDDDVKSNPMMLYNLRGDKGPSYFIRGNIIGIGDSFSDNNDDEDTRDSINYNDDIRNPRLFREDDNEIFQFSDDDDDVSTSVKNIDNKEVKSETGTKTPEATGNYVTGSEAPEDSSQDISGSEVPDASEQVTGSEVTDSGSDTPNDSGSEEFTPYVKDADIKNDEINNIEGEEDKKEHKNMFVNFISSLFGH